MRPFPTPLAAALALALSVAAGSAQAQAAASLFDEQALRGFVSQQVAAQGGGLSRFDVQLGAPDTSRIALAPCRRTEPFVPTGARLWGRSSLGLRCVDGATWTLVVPVTVTGWGPALVAASPLAAGTSPVPADLREQEVELTRESPGWLRDAGQLQGRTLTRSLLPGQVLRADMLRATPVLAAGDPVRLRIQGSGFAISATGLALASASEGQTLRVRTDFGRVLAGIAREGRIVDVTP